MCLTSALVPRVARCKLVVIFILFFCYWDLSNFDSVCRLSESHATCLLMTCRKEWLLFTWIVRRCRAFARRFCCLFVHLLFVDPFLQSDLLHYAVPWHSPPPRVCTLSFFTIKVLTRLFQVWRLHKSFPFSLHHPIALISPRKRRVCLQGINPQTTTAPLLLVLSFLPLLLFLLVQLSHPTFIVSDQMSASIQVATQRLRSKASSLIFFPRPRHSARLLCGSLLWSSQFFFVFFFWKLFWRILFLNGFKPLLKVNFWLTYINKCPSRRRNLKSQLPTTQSLCSNCQSN